jgi:hypothetical protein
MSVYLANELREQLLDADDHRCAYCQTTQANSGYPMVVDHITPRSKGGLTLFMNLCFACYRCNLFKNDRTEGDDPLTGEMTTLFDPRRQRWTDHFAWSNDGVQVMGITPVGRVTVIALNMNNDAIVDARRNWVRVGWHPPTIQK